MENLTLEQKCLLRPLEECRNGRYSPDLLERNADHLETLLPVCREVAAYNRQAASWLRRQLRS